MYKKLLKLCIVCSLLFVSTGVTASMWDAWTDEDEEFNMMGTAPKIGSWKNSNRKKSPFVAVDCGSLSMELAPSELFGHKKGSFTSAISDKEGVFVAANGGTVFLDEVGNLSYEVQKQLLRALQEQKVRPVGSASDVKVDVRIIAATNEDLELAIDEGRFRQDLYHRINEFSLIVPPLRERVEDLEEFSFHFIKSSFNFSSRLIQNLLLRLFRFLY